MEQLWFLCEKKHGIFAAFDDILSGYIYLLNHRQTPTFWGDMQLSLPRLQPSHDFRMFQASRSSKRSQFGSWVGFYKRFNLWRSQKLTAWWLSPTPLKNDGVKVSWDDEIPKIWKVTKVMFQTTNQLRSSKWPAMTSPFWVNAWSDYQKASRSKTSSLPATVQRWRISHWSPGSFSKTMLEWSVNWMHLWI